MSNVIVLYSETPVVIDRPICNWLPTTRAMGTLVLLLVNGHLNSCMKWISKEDTKEHMQTVWYAKFSTSLVYLCGRDDIFP